jgi:type I restriction enzyme S subunit
MREDWAEVIYSELVEKLSTNKIKVKQKEYLIQGRLPVVDQGQELIGGYTDDPNKLLQCNLPVIVFGDHTRCVKLINFPFAPGADGTKVLQPKSVVNPKLLREFTKVIVSSTTSKGYARHYQHVETQLFPLAPLSEQRAIVSKIEQLFSALDNGTANLKKAQAQLKVYKQAVLKKAFNGELTREWRNGAGAGVGRDVARNVSTESVEGPFQIPETWTMVTTGSVMPDINNGYTPTSEHLSSGSGEVPFIKVYNLNFDGTYDHKDQTFIPEVFHSSKLKRSVCYPKDVLISIVGPPLGKVTVVPPHHPEWNINQAIVRFRPNMHVLSEYLAYYHQNPLTINWLEGTSKATAGQYNVKVTTCRAMPFPLCSIEEQHQIVQEIETRLSVCDKLEESIRESLQKSEALRQSILKRAFAGQLLTEEELAACRKEKDWEPAGVLLERIKGEKTRKK